MIPHCAPTPLPLQRGIVESIRTYPARRNAAFVIETPRQQSNAMLMLIIDFRVHSSAPISADLDNGSRLFLVFIYDINRINSVRYEVMDI